MNSKKERELELALQILKWDHDSINQDENRTWILGEDAAQIEELFFDPISDIFYFYGNTLINGRVVGYQRWFDHEEQEIFDPTPGFVVPLTQPYTLLQAFLDQEELVPDEEEDPFFLPWEISPFASGKQWLQKLETGFYFALRVDECNLVHAEVVTYPFKKKQSEKDE